MKSNCDWNGRKKVVASYVRQGIPKAPRNNKAKREIIAHIRQMIDGADPYGRTFSCDECGKPATCILHHSQSMYSWWGQCDEHAKIEREPSHFITDIDGNLLNPDLTLYEG